MKAKSKNQSYFERDQDNGQCAQMKENMSVMTKLSQYVNGALCCVLGQNALLSQGFFPLRAGE